jgi:hypothetical protein
VRVHPRVSRALFERERAVFVREGELLRRQGCVLLRVEFPTIDALIVPTQTLQFGRNVGQQMFVEPMLTLSARAVGLRMSLEDYDIRPPSISLHDAVSWEPLAFAAIPEALHDDVGQAYKVVHDKHPLTDRPFVCMRGVREYHEHPQHTGDDWMLYRRALRPSALLAAISRAFVSRPPILFIGLGLRWDFSLVKAGT